MSDRRLILLIAALSSRAFADPDPTPAPQAPSTALASPWGSSPYVVPYRPPSVVPRDHHGLTLEVSVGLGSTMADTSAGGASFAIGGWLAHDLSLSFRTTRVGELDFVGASAQYDATSSLWLGAGIGGVSERGMDPFGGTTRISGSGGFVRLGYNLAQSGPHALYLSGELQGGSFDDGTRAVALLTIGYQLL